MENLPKKAIRQPFHTQRQILQSAFHEFARYGFSGARMERIAKRAKTNKAMLHYYFGSKRKLYQAVLEKVFAYKDVDAFAKEFFSYNLSLPQQLYVILYVLVGLHLDREREPQRAFYSLMAWESAEGQNNMRFLVENFIAPRLAMVEQIIREGNEKKIFSVKNPWLMVYGLISRVLFYAMQRELYRGTFLYEKLYEKVDRESFLAYFAESVFREVSPQEKPLSIPEIPKPIMEKIELWVKKMRENQFSWLFR